MKTAFIFLLTIVFTFFFNFKALYGMAPAPERGNLFEMHHYERIDFSGLASDGAHSKGGNSNTDTSSAKAIDTTPPLLSALPADVSVGCGEVPEPAELTASDEVDGNVLVIFEEVKTEGNCANAYQLSRSWSATDAAGNTATATQLITVTDGTAPVLEGVPANLTATADGQNCQAVVIFTGITATDNCGEVSLDYSHESGSAFPLGETTVAVTATDACGNATTAEFKVIVADDTAPVPEVAELPVLNAECSLTVTEYPTATDNCGGIITATTSDPLSFSAQGKYSINWTYADENGNTSTQVQEVEIIDITAPSLSLPEDIVVSADAGACGAVVEFELSAPSDNCEGAILQKTDETGLTSGSTFPIGTTTLMYTVSDAGGNTVMKNFKVTVEDTELPTVVTKPVTVQLDASGNGTLTVEEVDNGSSDNCSIAELALDKSSFSCTEVGENTVTLTAIDESGNSASATAIITVVDNTPPVITAPADIAVSNDAGACGAVVTFDLPVFEDNCSGAEISQTDDTGLGSGDMFPIGTTTLSYSVVDASGNSSSISFELTVRDEEAPEITAPSPRIVATDAGECTAVVDLMAPEITDNCGVASIENDAPVDSIFPVGTTTVNWKITDLHGNESVIAQEVLIEDQEIPVVATRDLNVELDAEGNALISASEIDDGSRDNCGIASISLGRNSFSCAHIGANTVELTVTDVNGNIAKANATVTVLDNSAPFIEAGQIFEVDEKTTTGAVLGSIVGGDNCNIQAFSIEAGNIADAFTIDAGGTITVDNAAALDFETTPEFTLTISATDEAGNSASAEVRISLNNVNDKAPVLTFIPDMAGNEHEEISFTATSTTEDEAAGELRFSLAEGAPENATIDAVTGEFSWTPTEGQGPAAHAITVVVSDGVLNDSEEFFVWVEEVNEAPVITSEPALVAREGELYTYQLTASDADLPANTLTFEALALPSWLSYDAASQVVSGTPDGGVEESSLIRFQLSDGREIVTQEFTLVVEKPTGLIGSRKKEGRLEIIAYPNPTKGSLRLEMEEVVAIQQGAVSLLTLEGKLLLEHKGNLGQGEESLNVYLEQAKAGTYLLRIIVKDNIKTIKVIKL